MSGEHIHVLVIFGLAALVGYQTARGQYGWAVTFGLLFFATLKH